MNEICSPVQINFLQNLEEQKDENHYITYIHSLEYEEESTNEQEQGETAYVLEKNALDELEVLEYPMLKELTRKLRAYKKNLQCQLPVHQGQSAQFLPSSYAPANAMTPYADNVVQPLQQYRGKYNTKFGIDAYEPNYWSLPPALQPSRAILVLSQDIGLYPDVIDRWSSITVNHLNDKVWTSNQTKVSYVENLLGEDEKKIWIQWRMIYTTVYEKMVNIAENPQNIVSQVRRVFLLENPAVGSTTEQDQAYLDLERLSCDSMKDLLDYRL